MDPYTGGYEPSQEQYPDDFQSAAIYVGVMVASAAVFLAILKRSGFRAMVAVGRG